MKLGIWLVRKEAEALALKIHSDLGGEIKRPWLNLGKPSQKEFREKFRNFSHWILIMTTGIAVRYMEGLPKDKKTDPAVVVLDEGARFSISFLSGHEGGANALAYQVANITQAIPVITTATETLKPLVVGIGCRKNVTQEQIDKAVQTALGKVQKTVTDIREVATIDLKMNEPGLLEWCSINKLPLRSIPQELIQKRPWVTQPSEWVQQNIGVDGVCEPCALLSSIHGELILSKTALNGVTVAITNDPVMIT